MNKLGRGSEVLHTVAEEHCSGVGSWSQEVKRVQVPMKLMGDNLREGDAVAQLVGMLIYNAGGVERDPWIRLDGRTSCDGWVRI